MRCFVQFPPFLCSGEQCSLSQPVQEAQIVLDVKSANGNVTHCFSIENDAKILCREGRSSDQNIICAGPRSCVPQGCPGYAVVRSLNFEIEIKALKIVLHSCYDCLYALKFEVAEFNGARYQPYSIGAKSSYLFGSVVDALQ